MLFRRRLGRTYRGGFPQQLFIFVSVFCRYIQLVLSRGEEQKTEEDGRDETTKERREISAGQPDHFRKIYSLNEFFENASLCQHYAVRRSWGYFHHFLISYVSAPSGSVNVIHYAGNVSWYLRSLSSVLGTVQEEKLVLGDKLCKALLDVKEGLYLVDDPSYRNRNPQQIIERAKKRLKEPWYDVRYNNCEHFVRWVLTGEGTSPQMETLPTSSKILACCINEMKNIYSRFLFSAFRVLLFELLLFALATNVCVFNMDVAFWAAFISSLAILCIYLIWKWLEYRKLRNRKITTTDNPNDALFHDVMVSLLCIITGGLSGPLLGASLVHHFGVNHYMWPIYWFTLGAFICGFLGDVLMSIYGNVLYCFLVDRVKALGLE